jgi:hypothetical protein
MMKRRDVILKAMAKKLNWIETGQIAGMASLGATTQGYGSPGVRSSLVNIRNNRILFHGVGCISAGAPLRSVIRSRDLLFATDALVIRGISIVCIAITCLAQSDREPRWLPELKNNSQLPVLNFRLYDIDWQAQKTVFESIHCPNILEPDRCDSSAYIPAKYTTLMPTPMARFSIYELYSTIEFASIYAANTILHRSAL